MSVNTVHSAKAAGRAVAAILSVSFLPLCDAVAQEPPPTEVVITGSRIARPSDFESPSPVITVDRDAIDKSGFSNLQQLFDRVPANGNGAFSTRGNNQDSSANGAASISLRGLGADATLVLVNGRRVAISAFAESITTNFVDINSIPVSAIERIEVLKDGASAVYGSDAVAGVVNIILRDNFDGFELSASGGWTTESGYDETNFSGIWGMSGEDSNVTIIADYFKNSTLSNSERENSNGVSLGTADHSAEGEFDNRSSRSVPGSFVVFGPTIPDGSVARVDPSCPEERQGGANCFFDYGPFNLITPEAERTGFLLLAHQGLGNGLEVFAEAAVQHNRSLAQGAPTPLDDTAGLTVSADNPNNPFPDAEGDI